MSEMWRERAMNGNNIKSFFKDPTEFLSGKVAPPKFKCDTCEKHLMRSEH